MSTYKAHNLPSDIIHNIIDLLHDDVQDDSPGLPYFRGFMSEFTSAQLINKHWWIALLDHPAYLTYEFCYKRHDDNKMEDADESALAAERSSLIQTFHSWLMTEHRQGRIVKTLRIFYGDLDIYKGLCDLLDSIDKLGGKVELKNFVLYVFGSCTKLSLPMSLRAEQMDLRIHPEGSGLNWDSVGEHLRNDLLGLVFLADEVHCLPTQSIFKRLRQLELFLEDYQTEELQDFLQAHPTIEVLELHAGGNVDEPAPQFAINGLDKLHTLSCYGFHLDFGKSNMPSIKHLSISGLPEPLLDWSDMPDMLETLHIHRLGAKEALGGPSQKYDDYIGAKHTLFDPKQFHKLRNLKVLEIADTDSDALVELFNEDCVWDYAMPLLEVLKLQIKGIKKGAVKWFAQTHPLLRSGSYGVQMVRYLPDRLVEPLGPRNALRFFPSAN